MSIVRNTTTEFIMKYKELECLWQVNHKHYKNKNVKFKAQLKLLKILKQVDSHANIDSVTRKINNIRTAFNKEHKRITDAKASGTSRAPKLWYYDLLSFVAREGTEPMRFSDIDITMSDDSSDSQGIPICIIDKLESLSPKQVSKTEQLQQSTQTDDTKRKINNTEMSAKKVKIRNSSVSKPEREFRAFKQIAKNTATNDAITNKSNIIVSSDAPRPEFIVFDDHIARVQNTASEVITNKSNMKVSSDAPRLEFMAYNDHMARMQNTIAKEVVPNKQHVMVSPDSPKPEFRAFGEHVAEKLRTMNSNSAKFCQKVINDAIFQAEFNNLNYTSRIVTDYLQDIQVQSQPVAFTPIRLPYQAPQQLMQQPLPFYQAQAPSTPEQLHQSPAFRHTDLT